MRIKVFAHKAYVRLGAAGNIVHRDMWSYEWNYDVWPYGLAGRRARIEDQ